MKTPLPTPYDIIGLDGFPTAPPLSFWVLLILAAAAAYILIQAVKKKINNPRVELNDLDSLKQRLKTLSLDKSNDTERISAEASILIRGYLSFRYDIPFDSFSSSELKKYSETTGDENLKKIVSQISELEIIRYQPPIDFAQNFKKALEEISTSLNSLERESYDA